MPRKSEPEQPLIRNGKPCQVLADGNPRRMSDGKNAVRKMTPEQRAEFVAWMRAEGYLE